MAKYYTETKDGDKVKEVVVLEMDGWQTPAEWDGKRQCPRYWPAAVVNGLIALFTGENPQEAGPEGVQIPDPLGWHIAALMEDWIIFSYTNAGPPEKMMPPQSQIWYANGLSLHRTWADGKTAAEFS